MIDSKNPKLRVLATLLAFSLPACSQDDTPDGSQGTNQDAASLDAASLDAASLDAAPRDTSMGDGNGLDGSHPDATDLDGGDFDAAVSDADAGPADTGVPTGPGNGACSGQPFTRFAVSATGDSNPNYTSGVGVRTTEEVLIFSGYVGPASNGSVNRVDIQHFDLSGVSKGPSAPLFTVPGENGLQVNGVAVAPSGRIAIIYSARMGDPFNDWGVFLAFLDPDLALVQTTQVEAYGFGAFVASAFVEWLDGQFVASWGVRNGGMKIAKFSSTGAITGGTNAVPNDNANGQIFTNDTGQGEVAFSNGTFAAVYSSGGGARAGFPFVTRLGADGQLAGAAIELPNAMSSAAPTIAGTSDGFVAVYNGYSAGGEPSVISTFIPVVGPSGTGQILGPRREFDGATAARASTDGFGAAFALLYNDGSARFSYIEADGTIRVAPEGVIQQQGRAAAGDAIHLMNDFGSFALSLFSGAEHLTRVAISTCPLGISPVDAGVNPVENPDTCLGQPLTTQFGHIATGDSDPNYTSGVGVRTASELLAFNGYVGPDAGVNRVDVQHFDLYSGASRGPAAPLFVAAGEGGLFVSGAAVSPDGHIAIIYFARTGDPFHSWGAYIAFLDPSLAVIQTTQLVALGQDTYHNQAYVEWLDGSFVASWIPYGGGMKIAKFSAEGGITGGLNAVPNDRPDSTLYTNNTGQGEVAFSGGIFAAIYSSVSSFPYMTLLDRNGRQVGAPVQLPQASSSATPAVGGTSEGFITMYNGGVATQAVVATFVGLDGTVGPSRAFEGGWGARFATNIRASSDGVGAGFAILYPDGAANFVYVSGDGSVRLEPQVIIQQQAGGSFGDEVHLMNFGGSFALSLFSGVEHRTRIAASGCAGMTVPAADGGVGPDGGDAGCSPLRQFSHVATGDTNPAYTSGVGVRTSNEILAFSAYSDLAGNKVDVQHFDLGTGARRGPPASLFEAEGDSGIRVTGAAVSPAGEVALVYFARTADPGGWAAYASFFDSGLTFRRTAQLSAIGSDSYQNQGYIAWLNGEFVASWVLYAGSMVYARFAADGTGGSSIFVPTDRPDGAVFSNNTGQGEVGYSQGVYASAYNSGGDRSSYPFLSLVDAAGAPVGVPFELPFGRDSTPIGVSSTGQGFMTVYNGWLPGGAPSVVATFVPSGGPPLGTSYSFAGREGAIWANAIRASSDGVGAGFAVLYPDGAATFLYLDGDGTSRLDPELIIQQRSTASAADQIHLMTFEDSFALSLFSAAEQVTRVAASGCD